MQKDLRENYCLRSIGQELERIHALCLRIYKPHTSTTMESTHMSQMQENLKENYCLRSIAQELERLCSAIEDIEDAHLKEEKKRMDYSFYGSSPSPSAASSPEGPENEAATPSAPAAEDESINDELFEEYFGSYLTHGSTHSQLSLHAPTYHTRRSHSQTLV